VALSGKVYCKVDASYGAIETGDLLTSSPTVGYAMKLAANGAGPGTIVGKALEPLTEGCGEILVLAGLR